MEDLDKFISFIYGHIDEDRVEFSKKVKYGHRYYYIYLNLKKEIDSSQYRGDDKQLTIIVDNRNMIIEIGQWEDLLVFENPELVKKWSDILEEHYNNRLSSNLKVRVETFLSKNIEMKDKDLWREWSMNKLFDSDLDKKTDTE